MSLTKTYRPETFDDMIGHEKIIGALKNAIKKDSARAFLFIGPSGVGKTTLARICANEVGVKPQDLTEIDAATYTGIDDMRGVASSLMYRPIGDGSKKAVIVDEVQALTKQAWQSLLKVLEEPPEWGYWFLCTTDGGRIAPTIRTRCLTLDLKPVPAKEITGFLKFIAGKEDMVASADVASICAKEANGSPRQAIANLSLCAMCKTADEALELLRDADSTPDAFELAQALSKNAPWPQVQAILVRLKDAEINPESIRHKVRDYMTKVVLNAKKEASAGRGIEILDAFSTPCHPNDGISPIVIACGKAVLS